MSTNVAGSGERIPSIVAPRRLGDKVAIITGAGSVGPGIGNGKASAILYARHGAKVVCVDINPAAAEETRQIIEGEGGTSYLLYIGLSVAYHSHWKRSVPKGGLPNMKHANGYAGPWFPLVDIETENALLSPIFRGMQARGAGPLHIHRTIAHAPQIYEGFAAFATALRQPGATSRADRELVILRTTHLKGAEYEEIQHRRIGLACGLTQQQVDSVRTWREQDCYSSDQRLWLAFTDAMADNGSVGDALLAQVKAQFSLQAIVEMAMVSALYTAVAQFSRTVRVQPESEVTDYGVSDRQY